MSYDEFHFGKIRKVDLEGKTQEEWAKDKYEKIFPKRLMKCSFHTTYVDLLLDNSGYLLLNNELYEVIEHETSDESYFNELIEEPDGTFRFRCHFYNGGTCLEEMLEESIQNLKKINHESSNKAD